MLLVGDPASMSPLGGLWAPKEVLAISARLAPIDESAPAHHPLARANIPLGLSPNVCL